MQMKNLPDEISKMSCPMRSLARLAARKGPLIGDVNTSYIQKETGGAAVPVGETE